MKCGYQGCGEPITGNQEGVVCQLCYKVIHLACAVFHQNRSYCPEHGPRRRELSDEEEHSGFGRDLLD